MGACPILNVNRVRNVRFPNRREPQGNGVSVVVRGRESRPQGEGRQVRRMSGHGGTRDAERRHRSGHSLLSGPRGLPLEHVYRDRRICTG